MRKEQRGEALAPETPPERLWALAEESTTIAYEVAKNPSAPPELLEALASRRSKRIQQAVAANPNTPLPLLFTLGRSFPEALLGNLAFSLLLIEKPNLFHEMPPETQRALLRSEGLPAHFLETLATDKNIKIRIL